VGLSGCRKGGDALERYHPEETQSQGGRLITKLWEQETRGGGYSKNENLRYILLYVKS
jgi:hypothetical protein